MMDELQAGRELDARIAVEVMGWKRMSWHDYQSSQGQHDARTKELTYGWHLPSGEMVDVRAEDCDDYYCPTSAWSPSTDIEDAWDVVEKFDTQIVSLGRVLDGRWRCSFMYADSRLQRDTSVYALTAPIAICKAALKAVAVKEEA